MLLTALLSTAGCPTDPPGDAPTPEPPLPPPEGWTYSDPVECADPVSGIDRFSEEAVERGLTEVLSDPSVLGPGAEYGRGGSLVARDFDGDGDVDLLFGRLQAPPDIYENDGTGRFTLGEQLLELRPGMIIPAIGAVDLDGDRLPEVVLGGGRGFIRFDNLGDMQFASPRPLFPEALAGEYAYLTIAFGDHDRDGDLDVALPSIGGAQDPGGGDGEPDPAPDFVLTRDGDDATAVELLADGLGSTVQVGVFTDRDADGDLDLFLPSDSGPPSRFWTNDDGAWVDDAPALDADLSMAAMGIDAADLDGDGLLDYCMSDTGPPVCIESGAGTYVETGTARGLLPASPVGRHGTVGWGFDLADFDADGVLDAAQASGPFPDGQGPVDTDLPNLLWHGRADGRFDEVGADLGFDSTDNDLGLATADFDGDGFLDIVVAGPLDTPQLFMNRCSAGAWLEISMHGPAENAEGHHARVEVVWGGGRRQIRELHNLRGQAEGPASLHFGLGDVDVVDSVVVHWMGGHVSRAERVPTRRRIAVTHPDAD